MKTSVLWLAFMSALWGGNDIARQNRLKREAEAFREQGQYAEALLRYDYLIDSLGLREVPVRVNRAHTLYALGKKERARGAYAQLAHETKGATRAMMLNQYALSLPLPQARNEALEALKEALRADPKNETARYNYQWLLHQKEDKQNADDDNKQENDKGNQGDQGASQSQKGNQNSDNTSSSESDGKDSPSKEGRSDGDGDEGSERADGQKGAGMDTSGSASDEGTGQDSEASSRAKGVEGEQEEQTSRAAGADAEDKASLEDARRQSTAQKLNQMHLTPAQAQRLLEAMRVDEVQYLQQKRRKATQPASSNEKPDW